MVSITNFHRYTNTTVWAILAPIGIILPLFPHSPTCTFLHRVIMWVVAVFNVTAMIAQVLNIGGFFAFGVGIHDVCGVSILFLILIIFL